MKKLLLSILLLTIASVSFAKKIKFSVNMTGIVKNVTGIHVAGDFQVLAGYPLDWDSGTTQLIQDVADTNIYSIVVDIPAFRAYEFRYFNGNMGYDAEFVPVPSRVLFNFDDNRWLYLDSLSNDTTFVGTIPYGGNAPFGKRLLRHRVDMQLQTVNTTGAHVTGSYDSVYRKLYSFDGMVYEYIGYIDTTLGIDYTYRYMNGILMSDMETITGTCTNGFGDRTVSVTQDTMLDVVCYAWCMDCVSVGIGELGIRNYELGIYPNPTSDYTTLQFNDPAEHSVNIMDVRGRTVRTYKNISSSLRIEKGNLSPGIYSVNIMDTKNNFTTSKLIIEQ